MLTFVWSDQKESQLDWKGAGTTTNQFDRSNSFVFIFFFISQHCGESWSSWTENEKSKSKTVNALRVAWLINLIASWLVFDATINILGKYILMYGYIYICAKLCACHLAVAGKFCRTELNNRKNAFHCFRATEIVSIVCPKVTHWWCRLFIKLNSLCHVFMAVSFRYFRFDWSWSSLMWFPMRPVFVWQTEEKNFFFWLILTPVWFDLIYVSCVCLNVCVWPKHNRSNFITSSITANISVAVFRRSTN